MYFYLLETDRYLEKGDAASLFHAKSIFTTFKLVNKQIELPLQHIARLELFSKQAGLQPRPHLLHSLQKCISETSERGESWSGAWKGRIIISLDKRETWFTFEPYVEDLSGSSLIWYEGFISYETPIMKKLPYTERREIMDYARARNASDAITSSLNGVVLETAYSNLFWTDGNCFYTPDKELPLLYGITITELEKCLRAEGVEFRQVEQQRDSWIREDLFYFTCNCLTGLRPVDSIDGRQVNRSEKLERELKDLFQRHIKKSIVSETV